MSNAERLAWLRLHRTENVGPITFQQLLQRFGSASEALQAIPDLAARGGLKRKLRVPTLKSCEDELDALDAIQGRMILMKDTEYPPLLKNIPDAPPVLFAQGHIHLLKKPCVAIVGARNASLNGRRMAETIARILGNREWIVVSGIAAGIDAAAHAGALLSGTVGVIAGGLDHVYPPENASLYEKMREAGAIVTEMPLGSAIKPQLFPRRNRIISGLSRGLVVVEAALKSGSLITARLAAEHGREVMAIPGSPLDPRASGTNRLIKDGAHLVTSAEEIFSILENYAVEEPNMPLFVSQPIAKIDESSLDEARPRLMGILSPTPTPVDEAIRLCNLPSPIVWALLLELELAGKICRLPGNQVALITDLGLLEA